MPCQGFKIPRDSNNPPIHAKGVEAQRGYRKILWRERGQQPCAHCLGGKKTNPGKELAAGRTGRVMGTGSKQASEREREKRVFVGIGGDGGSTRRSTLS